MLSNYQPKTTTIQTSGGEITLRGLSVDDLSTVIDHHGELIGTWFERDIDLSETLMKAPAMVAEMIALAAGEPEAFAIAAKLPISLQLRAIQEIFRLTFTEVDLGEVFRLFVAKIAPVNQPVTH